MIFSPLKVNMLFLSAIEHIAIVVKICVLLNLKHAKMYGHYIELLDM